MLEFIEKFCNILELIITRLDSVGFGKLMLYTVYLLFLLGLFNWKLVTTEVYDVITKYQTEKTIESVRTRESVNGEIDKILKNLRLSCNADRALLFEYHNTVQSIGGLHFKFMSVSSEDVGKGVEYVGQKYQSVNTGLLQSFTSDLDDRSCLAIIADSTYQSYPVMQYMMKNDDTKVSYYSVLQGDLCPLGFISVQWDELPDGTYPDHSSIHPYMQSASLKITALLNKVN